jgi:hypothetical protein
MLCNPGVILVNFVDVDDLRVVLKSLHSAMIVLKLK